MVSHVIFSSTYLLEAIEVKPCSIMTSIMMHHFGKLIQRVFEWCTFKSLKIYFKGLKPNFIILLYIKICFFQILRQLKVPLQSTRTHSGILKNSRIFHPRQKLKFKIAFLSRGPYMPDTWRPFTSKMEATVKIPFDHLKD